MESLFHVLQEGTYEWCRDWRPPPLPPEDSNLFRELYHFMKSNKSHWESFQSYHEFCNISLPILPTIRPTVSIERTTVTKAMTSTVKIVPAKASNHAVPIIISFLTIALVVIFVCFIWKLKKKKKGRTVQKGDNDTSDMEPRTRTEQKRASLPLREYEATNYLDNKARYNQCWNKSRMVQQPDPGGNRDSSSLDKTKQVLEMMAVVEPVHDSMILTKTSKLFLATGALSNEEKKVSSNVIKTEIHDNKIGCQNLSFATDSDEKLPSSPGASSVAPLFDDIDGHLLPNVPQINKSGMFSKNGNDYTKFPEVTPSKQSDILQGPLPPIVDIKHSHSSESPSLRRKKKNSSITDTRVSEPVTNTSLICEDLLENRKSV